MDGEGTGMDDVAAIGLGRGELVGEIITLLGSVPRQEAKVGREPTRGG